MASLLSHPIAVPHAFTKLRQPAHRATVQMTVRVAIPNAQLARCLLHGLLGDALGVHTIDIDRRLECACLHVELDRARVPDVMSLLIRTLPGAEFGVIRHIERNHL